jgi:GDP-L-fucose synthase
VKGLARVSSQPGKTQTINFYELGAKVEGVEERKAFYLVDLPGYGYAKTGKEKRKIWSKFIEEYLLTSPLEITNEGYALAKISGLKLCEYLNTHHPEKADFISVMPCNLYGPGDNYHPEHSHVIPALLRKFHDAKETGSGQVVMWGTGSAMREFLHIDDIADACFFLMQHYSGDRGKESDTPGLSWINIGCGSDLTMKQLGAKIAEIVGFKGKIVYDHIHPDGTPRKLLDSSRLFALGWKPSISFEEGLRQTYEDYKINKDNYRK